MKKLLFAAVAALSLVTLLNGCIAIGTGPKSQQTNATLGQQLIDLQNAKNSGAISEVEYQSQKVKLLGNKSETNPAK